MMAVQAQTRTIGTTATTIEHSVSQSEYFATFTVPATPAVEAGGSDVTFGTGKTLPAGEEITYFIEEPRDALYLVVAAGTLDIDVLYTQVSATA